MGVAKAGALSGGIGTFMAAASVSPLRKVLAFWTPATGLGQRLLDALVEHAGLTFSLVY